MSIRSALGDFWFRRTRARVAAVCLALYLVAVSLILIAQLESTWGQQDQIATVVRVELTGSARSCGRSCTCPEARVILDLADARPGFLLECKDRYRLGQSVEVRRKRSSPREVELAPPAVGDALVTALLMPPLILGLAYVKLRTPGGRSS